jgi:hypothetical protein
MTKKTLTVGDLVLFHIHARYPKPVGRKGKSRSVMAAVIKARNLLKSADIIVQDTGKIYKNIPYYFLSKIDEHKD